MDVKKDIHPLGLAPLWFVTRRLPHLMSFDRPFTFSGETFKQKKRHTKKNIHIKN